MPSLITYPHIIIDPQGVPRLEASRYKVVQLAAEHYHLGWSAEEMLKQHSDLRPEQIYAALTYFYDHREQLVTELESKARIAEVQSHAQTLSRDELLRRQASQGG